MYLAKLTLDPRNARARCDLADPYEMHRTLARAFVVDEHSKPSRFLWRMEATPNAWSSPTVLVQSPVEGRWEALPPKYLQCPVEIKGLVLDELIHDGRCYRFRLLANPTVAREGKRQGLQGEMEQLAWLKRQGERHGFTIQTALVITADLLISHKGTAVISIQRASFEGLLEVRQSLAFKGAVGAGIGPAKAFGCGLLSVAPF